MAEVFGVTQKKPIDRFILDLHALDFVIKLNALPDHKNIFLFLLNKLNFHQTQPDIFLSLLHAYMHGIKQTGIHCKIHTTNVQQTLLNVHGGMGH